MKMKEFTDTELEQEQWRDIDGYDGMYQVSDLGRVRSRNRGEWRVMSASKNNSGYLIVQLSKYNKKKHFLVHRLVASVFIPNSDESKTQINHINEVKTDNRASNLEWCTSSYNMNYNGLYWRRKNYKRHKLKYLYRPDLTYNENLEIFKANGIECCGATVTQLRKDLGLINNKTKRDEIRPFYNPNLSINENLEVFRENGIECGRNTVKRLRRELGLVKEK